MSHAVVFRLVGRCYPRARLRRLVDDQYVRQAHTHRIVRHAMLQHFVHLTRLDPPLELRAAVDPLERTFGKEDLRAQSLEAVAPAEPVHDPNQVVQPLGVGVRHRMLEVGQNFGHPVLERLGQRLEVRMQAARDRLEPRALGVICVAWRRVVVDPIEDFLEPVRVPEQG